MNKISLVIAVLLLLVLSAVAAGWLVSRRGVEIQAADAESAVPAATPVRDDPAASHKTDLLIPAAVAKAAPELAEGKWINTEPLDLTGLRGRVVYVEFWTFGCYNCINMLPTVKRFHADFADKGLTVIGVETPELEYERSFAGLKAAVQKRGIEYAVLTDYESKTWEAYAVGAWPTIVIVDKQGRIRYRHVGEGAYDQQEAVIKMLLAE